jgi:hypothetical protein
MRSVQLRPVVRPASEVLNHDRSLFERLYLEADSPDVRKCMLDVRQGQLTNVTSVFSS